MRWYKQEYDLQDAWTNISGSALLWSGPETVSSTSHCTPENAEKFVNIQRRQLEVQKMQ